MPEKIAVIGAGMVGSALGDVWHVRGHHVVYGLRDPAAEKYASLSAPKDTVAGAVAASDLLLLALPWGAVDAALAQMGDLSGKVVIDCTNPIKEDFSGLDRENVLNGARYVEARAKGATVVKAFNQTGFSNMANSRYPNGQVVSFVCGDDIAAVDRVGVLSDGVGFETVKVPSLDLASNLEDMAWLWISLAMKHGHGPDWAFSVVRR